MLDERQMLSAVCNADLRLIASSVASGKLLESNAGSRYLMFRIDCVASTMTPHDQDKLYKLKDGWD